MPQLHGHRFQTFTIDDIKFDVAEAKLKDRPLITYSVSHAGRIVGYLQTETGNKVYAYNWSCAEEIAAYDKGDSDARAILYAIRAVAARAGFKVHVFKRTPEMAAAERMSRADYISECISALMAIDEHSRNRTESFDARNALSHYKWRLGIPDNADELDSSGFGALAEILSGLADQDRGSGRPSHHRRRTGQALAGLFFRDWRRGHQKQLRHIYTAAWFCDEMRSQFGGK